uniref:Uncharacterized protein n=1 Tax=Salmonella phage PMBT26 TaxID=3229745 RepID=A0AB39C1E1_9CAUD
MALEWRDFNDYLVLLNEAENKRFLCILCRFYNRYVFSRFL